MEKKCFKCGEVKDISEFYKHKEMSDGHLNKCKECTKKDVRSHRAENIERIRAYDRERGATKARIEKNKAYQRNHRKEITKYKIEWRKRNKDKANAYRCVSYHVKAGNIKREACGVCGCEKTQAHHEDYSKPLEIVWLCEKCHKALHRKKREEKRSISELL